MDKPNADYHPIACSFHDRLEDWAIRRTPVEIVWRDGEIQQITTVCIADVFAQDGADHLRLDSGEVIRLDRLVSVNGVMLPDAC